MIKKHNKTLNSSNISIGIIGAGVAGTSAALYFGQLGLNITLFEKESSLISGPPFCHLHAGGNLYREISDAQCLTLLRQSIDFLRFYPYIVDYRPTVIALPTTDKSTPQALLPRLELLTSEYETLIHQDPNNEVLGKSKNYYRIFEKEEVLALKEKAIVTNPQSCEEWMIPVAQNIALDKVQFPLIMVQEYGLNLFRLAAGTALNMESIQNVALHTNSIVHNVQQEHKNKKWIV